MLDKPKGTLQKSKFDQNVEQIKELMGYGLSIHRVLPPEDITLFELTLAEFLFGSSLHLF